MIVFFSSCCYYRLVLVIPTPHPARFGIHDSRGARASALLIGAPRRAVTTTLAQTPVHAGMARNTDLRSFLATAHLSEHEPALHELGVETISDLKDFSASDLEGHGLPPNLAELSAEWSSSGQLKREKSDNNKFQNIHSELSAVLADASW